MGSISVACYKPKPGQEGALLELVLNHLPPLRQAGLVTDRDPIIMQCEDGTIVEIFEWISQEKLASAHTDPVVQELWKKFEVACFYKVPAEIAEFQNMFGHFKAI